MYIDLYQDHVKMLKLKMVLLNMSIFGTVYYKVSINRLGKQYRKDAHERLIKFSGCGWIFFKNRSCRKMKNKKYQNVGKVLKS